METASLAFELLKRRGMLPQRALPRGIVPKTFVGFARHTLKVSLSKEQRTLCRVAFDRVEPKDLHSTERSAARKLFGDVDVIPPSARDVLVAVCGARGGKTYVLVALYSLYRALTADLSTLAPGEEAVALIVAPDMRLARQALRYVLGAAKSAPDIAKLLVRESVDSITLERDGHRVAVECLPATRGGSAVRGRSLVSAALDECAFFRDANYAVNDTEVFKAVAPRVLKGGLTVLSSTPWAERGLLHSLWRANYGKPTIALAAHAPTLLLRNDEHTQMYVQRERERDPDNARREFDAEFVAAGAEQFLDPRAIEAATNADMVLPFPRQNWAPVAAGGDFAFRSDSSAIVVVQRDRDDRLVVSLVEERVPGDEPLKPSETVASFVESLKPFGLTSLMADQHYFESIAEHLRDAGLVLVPAPEGAKGKEATYVRFRSLLHEGRIVLPQHPRLLRQLGEVRARPRSGGGLSIETARSQTGGHGDLVSALVLAVWAALHARPGEPPAPEPGTPEALALENARHKRGLEAEILRRQRKRLRWG